MNEEIRILDLFSGIGGFSLGLEWASPTFQTVAFCERDPFAQRVLRKHWPDVPIYDDVKTIPTDGLGRIDLVTGGFPCQPWSIAGKREGAEDKEGRDLWPAMVALVEKLRPRFLLGENVRGFVNEPMGLERSLSDLESIGYQAVPFIIPACSKNAPHRRDRVWIVAKSNVADTKSYGNRRVSGELVKEGETKKGRGVAHVLQESVNDGQDVAEVRKTSKGKGWTDNSCNSSSSKSEAIADTNGEGLQRHDNADRSGNRQSGRWQVANEGLSGRKESSFNVADSDNTRNRASECEVNRDRTKIDKRQAEQPQSQFSRLGKDVGQSSRSQREDSGRLGEGKSKSSICRMDDGVSQRLDEAGRHLGWENGEPEGMERVSIGVKDRANRLKTLGNAVVPQVVEQIGKAILEGWSQVNEVA